MPDGVLEQNTTIRIETMKFTMIVVCAIASSLLLVDGASADEREELLRLRATTHSLIEVLVTEGVISRDGADRMLEQARHNAAEQVQADRREEAREPDPVDKGVVRVPYVPQFIRDEIRNQVRSELRADVTADVMAQARQERWGIPEALPGWTRAIAFSGDIRLRKRSIWDRIRQFQ
jgi:hypothetical protein